MEAFTVRFDLRDIPDIPPWGAPGRAHLHWFGLTDGWYCLETSAGRLLEYAVTAGSDPETSWCDYAAVRLFEDLLALWPLVGDPVPADIVAHFTDSGEGGETSLFDALERWEALRLGRIDPDTEPDAWDAVVAASGWMDERRLDLAYLDPAPRLCLWRIGPQVHLAWDAKPPWCRPRVRLALPFEAADTAVRRFVRELLEAMGTRVASIARDGWTRGDCTLDVPGLVREQAQREAMAATALAAPRRTDWDAVRANLRKAEG